MDINSLSREKIKAALVQAIKEIEVSQEDVRLLFSPKEITEKNFKSVCKVYAQIGADDFDTVVIIESNPGKAEKKLAMPSFKVIETHLGKVAANDKLRNDFADEDDDFFISDSAFDENVSLYQQLVMLQCTLDDFTVSHIQITDENSIIIKELALAIEEILALKNALVLCCCDLETVPKSEIETVMALLYSENFSGLMNYLNSEDSGIAGVGTFITGLLIAKKWDLNIHFTSDPDSGNVQAGFAVVQNQPILG